MQTISESSVRRLARREGYIVRKSRTRDPDSIHFGGFMLIDSEINGAVLGCYPFEYSADLDAIHDWLAS